MTDECLVTFPDSFQDKTPNVATTNSKSEDAAKSKRGRSRIRHICEICDREFTKKCGLSNHLLIHAGVKPFTCEICTKSFTKKCTLTVHLLTHSSERPHVCEVCKKSFARKTDLQKHKFVHTGEKRHICEICNSKFTHQNNLRRHKMKHLPKEIKVADDKKKGKHVLGINPNISKVLKDTANVKNISQILKQAIVKKINQGSPQSLLETNRQSHGNESALPSESLSMKNIKEPFINNKQQSKMLKPEAITKSINFTKPICYISNRNQHNIAIKNSASINTDVPIDSLKLNVKEIFNTGVMKKPETISKSLTFAEPIYNIINKNEQNITSDLNNIAKINAVIPIDSLKLKNVREIFINADQQNNSHKTETVLKLLNITQPICFISNINQINLSSNSKDAANINTFIPTDSLNKPETVLKFLNIAEPICRVNNINQQNITSETKSTANINFIPIDSLKLNNVREIFIDNEQKSNLNKPEAVLRVFNLSEPNSSVINRNQQNILSTSCNVLNNAPIVVPLNTNKVKEIFNNKDQQGNLNKSETLLKLVTIVEPISNISNGNQSNITNDLKEKSITGIVPDSMTIKNVKNILTNQEEQCLLNNNKNVTNNSKDSTNNNCVINCIVKDDHITNLKESDDVIKAREIKDIFNSLPTSVDNNKIHNIGSGVENKTSKKKVRKSLPNADSFPEPMSMESQILLELEKLKKARESLKSFNKHSKCVLSGSETLEKTIKKKDLCQSSSVDNDLEQALAIASSDVIKDTKNDQLSLPIDKNTETITLKTLENDIHILDIPSNATNNMINNLQFQSPINKDFQNITSQSEAQKSFAGDMHVLDISSDVTKNSINYDQLLIPKSEDAQNISRELKILDDIVKEYETSQISIPDNSIDVQLLSAIHDNVQCITSESQVLEDIINDAQVLDSPSNTINRTFMDNKPHATVGSVQYDDEETQIQIDSSDEIQILSSTFDHAEDDLLNSQKPFSCDVCSESFVDQKEFLMHVSSHISDDQTTCYLCDLELGDNAQLREHILTHYEDEDDDDDISLDEDFCKIGPLSPSEISLEDFDSIGFNENFEENVAKMYALAHIEMEMDGNDTDTDDETTILYSYSQTEYLSEDGDLPSEAPKTENTANKNNQNSQLKCASSSESGVTQKQKAFAKKTCFDFSKFNFMTQMQSPPTTKGKATSKLNSQNGETNTKKLNSIENSHFSMKNVIGCAAAHTTTSYSAINGIKTLSIDNENLKKFEASMNDDLLMNEIRDENINQIEICNNVLNEKDPLSQINIEEILRQFETTTNDLSLIESKDKNINQIEISKNILSENVLSKLTMIKNMKHIENNTNDILSLIENKDENVNQIEISKNVLNEKDVLSKLTMAKNMKQIENITNDILSLIENEDENISQIEISKNVLNDKDVLSKLTMDTDIKQIENTTNDILVLIENDNVNQIEISKDVLNDKDVLSKLAMAKNIKQIDNTAKDNLIFMKNKDITINQTEINSNINEEDRNNISEENESVAPTDNNIQPISFLPKLSDLDINLDENSSGSSFMDDAYDNNQPPFVCDFCDRTFTRKMYLHAHYLMHAGIKQYTCNVCNAKFGKKCALTVHSLVHTHERKHTCTECGKTFSRKTDLQMHAVIHTGQKPYSCDLCKKSFNSKNNLRRHKRSMESRKKFICYICNSRFSERLGLLSHVRIHIKQAEMKSTSGKLSENIRNCLMTMKEKFYECNECNMLFARRDRLFKHKLTHSAKDPHLCEFCGSTFKTKDQLKSHLLSHTENEFEDIEFSLGNLGDIDLASLEPTIHATKKTFTCDQCLKVYTKSSALKCHYLTHTGERPHKCHMCKKAFAQRTNLKRHILSHAGIKPFMCNICHKHFARKPYLRKHYLSHTSEELFTLLGNLPDV